MKILSGTVAAIPGLTVILANIGVPESFSTKLMGGLVTATSSFIAGYALARQKKLLARPTSFNRLSIVMFISFLACFFIYLRITSGDRILNSANHATGVLKPFWLSDECLQQIKSDGYSELKFYYEGKGPIDTDNLLQEKSAFSYWVTVGAIYLSFISLFGFLTAAFVSLWLYYEVVNKNKISTRKKSDQSKDNNAASKPAPAGRKK